MPRPTASSVPPVRPPRRSPPRCNSLDGKQWIKNSISVWNDLRKTADEQKLKHPAQFPEQLVERLIESFLPAGAQVVLDPFCGSGSTLVAAQRLGKQAIGCELSPDYVALTRRRLAECAAPAAPAIVHHMSAGDISRIAAPNSVDLCVTSPPYWNVLNRRRTADFKAVRHYGNASGDLGAIGDYGDYLDALTAIFSQVLAALKPGAHACIVVMDLRVRNQFYPLHSDLAARLQQIGFRYDDLVIWNRQAEYNFLRPLGYPAVFRINKVHEFILLMQKPKIPAQSPRKSARRRSTSSE
ncbi:MAG: site-specific DNA-methyltransferase [Planctomycetaceae bacterium]